MRWRSDRIIGERRGIKRTIKLGRGDTTSVYLDDVTWERLRLARTSLGKSTREIVMLAKQFPGESLSDQLRTFLHR